MIVFSSSEEDHLDKVDRVLSLVVEAGFISNLNKFFFFQETLEYFGHVIVLGTLSIARD